jgi:hypothetical protein
MTMPQDTMMPQGMTMVRDTMTVIQYQVVLLKHTIFLKEEAIGKLCKILREEREQPALFIYSFSISNQQKRYAPEKRFTLPDSHP